MNLVFVTETFPPEINGVAMTLQRLMRGLAACGYVIEIVRPRLVITLGRDAERVLGFFYPRARTSKSRLVIPRGRLPRGVPYIFHAKHPSWIQRQHDERLEGDYVSGLAAAIRWSFGQAKEKPDG